MKKITYYLLVLCLCCPLLTVSAAQPELPATLYYNPDGGSYYHADPHCPSVKEDYIPMTPFAGELLSTAEYSWLKPCTRCVGIAETPAAQMPEPVVKTDSGAADLYIDSEAAARAFAEALFASPYVRESLEGRTLVISETAYGWKAVLAPIEAPMQKLTLWFSTAGRIQQYQNNAYPLPLLEPFAIGPDDSLADVTMLDALRDALFPEVQNNTGGVYAHSGDAAFYAMDRFSAWIGLVKGTELPRLVSYGDFGTDAAHYAAYLTRGAAVALGRQALAEAYGISQEKAESLELMQAEFIPQAGIWTDADVPLPYWFIVLGDPADDFKTQYSVLIDAETGDVLEHHDPSTFGNG